MKFDINEVSNILKEEIKQYKSKLDISKVGRVVELGDGIARIYGLDDVMAGEMLEFENGVRAKFSTWKKTASVPLSWRLRPGPRRLGCPFHG